MKIRIPFKAFHGDYHVVESNKRMDGHTFVCKSTFREYFDLPKNVKTFDIVLSTHRTAQSYKTTLPCRNELGVTFLDLESGERQEHLVSGLRGYLQRLGIDGKTYYISVKY